jgi:hypothetical protein
MTWHSSRCVRRSKKRATFGGGFKMRARRRVPLVLARTAVVFGTPVLATGAFAASRPASQQPAPGAAGAGDPYFPTQGNGGYDVAHYGLDIRYIPASKVLSGTAQITANAT